MASCNDPPELRYDPANVLILPRSVYLASLPPPLLERFMLDIADDADDFPLILDEPE